MEKEKMDAFLQSLNKALICMAENLAPAFDQLTEAFRKLNNRLAYYRGSTPAHRYALAGHPYGNHTRGKKRWMREMKKTIR